MKKYILFVLLVILLGVSFVFREDLYKLYLNYTEPKEVILGEQNNYARDDSFGFIQLTTDFEPENRQDLLNIYYTVLNAGKEEFQFYCPDTYETCIEEVSNIANDQELLSSINNFVHPFNSFSHLETTYDTTGKVEITIEHTYSDQEKELLRAKVDSIEQEIWQDTMTTEEKIKAAHDYIINHSQYDVARSDHNIIEYQSDTAYGPLLQGYSLCGGYTDAMALFLNDLQLKNYKIASDSHIWNGVYLNNEWLHLDLTWDDPITSDGSNLLEYRFFLISTDTLKFLEPQQHIYDETIYQEMQS